MAASKPAPQRPPRTLMEAHKALVCIRPARDAVGARRGAPRSAASLPPAKLAEPEGGDPNALEPSIYRFILKHSLPYQLMLLGLTLVSFPFLYFSLDLPKTIVNRAIAGHQLPQRYLGYEFDQITYLLL